MDFIKEHIFNPDVRNDVISGVILIFLGILIGLMSSLFKKAFKSTWLAISNSNRRYLKREMNLNEYIEIKERIEDGGRLKWYERKGYNDWKSKEEEQIKKKEKAEELLKKSDLSRYIKEFSNWNN